MRGLLCHFRLTLSLNFRSRQALIYGYLVPLFFLIAFGSIFRAGVPPLLRELGQLITISILGGACFGMPTAMVAERERGVWRRYRLLPIGTGTLVISTMCARVVIILSSAVMQVVLAGVIFGMPMPQHPFQMCIASLFVTFAFLGMGLIIAMLADSVPAVQALGQAIFLPMIMIGGVGVPLWTLPGWAQHFASFLPGKYAVHALQECAMGDGLYAVGFDLLALLVIGLAACVAGAKMFRWDAREKADSGSRRWIVVALGAWLSVGAVAECLNRQAVDSFSASSQPSTQPVEPYQSITQQQIDAVSFNDLEPDEGTVTPVAKNLEKLDVDATRRVDEFRRELAVWPPGKDVSVTRRVRNDLSVAAICDLEEDPYEGIIALMMFEEIKSQVPAEDLKKILTFMIFNPDDPDTITAAPELGIPDAAQVFDINIRVKKYAIKLLGRLVGKLPAGG
jgi:ABC-2 type transport system permease protein